MTQLDDRPVTTADTATATSPALDPATAWFAAFEDALTARDVDRAAGYGYSFVPRQPGLVCQINGSPSPCNGAPTTAYWSYWHAPRHGSWAYSSSGAGSYNPAPNTVEGWAFGAGTKPSITPP